MRLGEQNKSLVNLIAAFLRANYNQYFTVNEIAYVINANNRLTRECCWYAKKLNPEIIFIREKVEILNKNHQLSKYRFYKFCYLL